MKRSIQYCAVLLFLLACISCTKKEKANCLFVPAALILPGYTFQVVDKTTGADLFFSAQPAYSMNDIKVVFKNASNKADSLAPPQKINNGSGDHFKYIVPLGRMADTCFIKIKNLKTDTLISTLENIKSECSSSIVVTKVQVNKSAPVAYANTDIVVIRK